MRTQRSPTPRPATGAKPPGPRPAHSPAFRKVYQNRLKELGKVTFDRIEVEPFAVKRFGKTFGLIVSAPENNDDIWWVTAEPGDYMAFSAPWDSGEHDTLHPQQ
jgi:hypothetical protein